MVALTQVAGAPEVSDDGERRRCGGHVQAALDDPEIRELAGKFAPADILLDPNPRLVLPPRYSR